MNPNLFTLIEEVTSAPHGWCSFEKAKALAGMILATRPSLVVEIGVWSGKSLLPMALACKEVGRGRVIGIDPYSPDASTKGQNGENAEWWASVENHEAMYQLFLANLKHFGVEEWVELWRMPSDEVSGKPASRSVGLLHIDGNHGEQAERDVRKFSWCVAGGGFLVLDDLHWDGGAVSRAVGWLAENRFVELYRVQSEGNDWAVFQRIP